MTCPIAWCAFSWDAFATIFTGLMAVGGAVYIGRKQLTISDRQATIADNQVELLRQQVAVDRVKVRAELFDRRMAVSNAITNYIRESMRIRYSDEINMEAWSTLTNELNNARFLFSGSVQQALNDVADLADSLVSALEEAREAAHTSDPDRDEKRKQPMRIRKQLREKAQTLPDIMGEEMRLYLE